MPELFLLCYIGLLHYCVPTPCFSIPDLSYRDQRQDGVIAVW